MTYSVVINEKGGATETRSFDKDEITIGRVKENDIVLAKNNISKRHVRIVRKDGRFKIIDLKSTNGTYINGKRVDGPYDLKDGDKLYVGDYTIELDGEPAAEEDEAPPPIKTAKPPPPPEELSGEQSLDQEVAPPDDDDGDWGKAPAAEEDDDWGIKDNAPAAAEAHGELDIDALVGGGNAAVAQQEEEEEDEEEPPPPPPAKKGNTAKAAPIKPTEIAEEPTPDPVKPEPVRAAPAAVAPRAAPSGNTMTAAPSQMSVVNKASHQVHKRLLKSLDLRRLDVENLDEVQLRARASQNLEELLDDMAVQGQLPEGVDREELKQAVLDEALGLGPLEELMRDDEVTEVMVNGPAQIFIERNGKLTLSDRTFADAQGVLTVIERIVARVGRRIDESSPMVDARLPDGSRVNAVVAPVAIHGPCLTIRKFAKETLTVDDLVMKGTLTAEMADFLQNCVNHRASMIISGGTGSGKTTTLNVLSSFIPENERIITIEDAAELKLTQAHVVSLETRPPNLEGRGEILIRDLVRNALRMRPDRIVVGECRGGEALDMLQAMNTGHDGSLTTVHSNSPRDALNRLETLVLMSGMDLPVRAIRDQVASALTLIVQQTRFSDGSRKITHISEVTGMEGDIISMQDIFVFEQTGFDKNGKVKGTYRPTGQVPKFYEELKSRGVNVDFAIFQTE